MAKRKKLYVTHKELCYSYRCLDDAIVRTEVEQLYGTHEEADTRMIFHLQSLIPAQNVVFSTADTDVMAILLGNLHKIDPAIKVWIEAGTQGKNNLCYMNISELAKELGTTLCRAIPGFHAFI